MDEKAHLLKIVIVIVNSKSDKNELGRMGQKAFQSWLCVSVSLFYLLASSLTGSRHRQEVGIDLPIMCWRPLGQEAGGVFKGVDCVT